MHPNEIEEGKTYIGENGIKRKVIKLDETKRPEMLYHYVGEAPDGGGVIFIQNNRVKSYDYLVKFAQWAIEQVE